MPASMVTMVTGPTSAHSPGANPATRTLATRLLCVAEAGPVGRQGLVTAVDAAPILRGRENVQPAVWHRTAGG